MTNKSIQELLKELDELIENNRLNLKISKVRMLCNLTRQVKYFYFIEVFNGTAIREVYYHCSAPDFNALLVELIRLMKIAPRKLVKILNKDDEVIDMRPYEFDIDSNGKIEERDV